MNIVHLIVVKNSFYISESGRTIQKSAHSVLFFWDQNLAKRWDQTVEYQPEIAKDLKALSVTETKTMTPDCILGIKEHLKIKY